MPRSEEVNQLIREQRQFQILQTAARVFSRQGYGATRIADIAAAGQISQGLLYRYYASKEDIFAAVVEAITTASQELVAEAKTQPGSSWDKLLWLTDQFLQRQYRLPEFGLTMLQTFSNPVLLPETREFILSRNREVIADTRELIAEAQNSGHIIAGDVDQLTFLYFASMQGSAVAAAFLERPAAGYPQVEMVLRFLKAEI